MDKLLRSTRVLDGGDEEKGKIVTTVADVAAQARVSPATVSRVLNGHSTVSADMRRRVLEAVEALDFRPNTMAQGLRRGRGNTVALLIGDIEQTHFPNLTKHIQEAIEQIGYDLLLYNLGHREDRLRLFLNRAVAMRLRGLVVASTDVQPKSIWPLLRQVSDAGTIVVSTSQNFSRHGIVSVVHDDRTAAMQSVRYLIERGRKAIAYLGRIQGSAVGTERFEGYKSALRAAGMPLQPELVWDVYFRFAAGRDAIAKARDKDVHFDGIQAGSDELAIGAISSLHDYNLRVPEDVSVIGFGDLELSAHLRPSVTTLSSQAEMVAKRVRDILAAPPYEAKAAKATLIPRELIRRMSA